MKLKFTNRTPRCGYCRHEIIGEGFPHDGTRYCSRACRELGIYNRSQTREKNWMALFAFPLFLLVADDARGHDPYGSWTIPGQNKSCCNTTDCAPTRAKFERGNWWAFVNSKRIWVKIPDDRIVRYKTDDTDAHLCYGESFGEVYCFRPPKLGM